MRTIAIFGAGPGLGLAVARRFGREGFRVGLVARDRAHLDTLSAELAAGGVEAAGVPADLTDPAAAVAAADTIEARFGPIDVLEYSPGGGSALRTPASQLDVPTVSPLLGNAVLAPVALVARLLPGMLERGDGGLLFALGASAKYPMPHLAAAGLALASLRNYAHTLHAELGPQGVYAGALLIGALIEGTPAHRNATAWAGGQQLPVVKPEDLAGHFWDLYTQRDRAEAEA